MASGAAGRPAWLLELRGQSGGVRGLGQCRTSPSQPPHSQPSHQTFYDLVSLLLFRRSYIKVCLSKSLKRFSKLYSREQLYRSSKVIQQLIRGRYSSNSNLKTFVSQVQSFIILVSQRSSLLVFTIRRSLVFLNLFKNKLLGFLKVYNKS